MEQPNVSVVIPTFNGGRFVRDAVDSALEQTYPSVEILVVDDGSTDDTQDLLDAYRGRVQYIRQDNRGPAAARNAGIRKAHGAFIGILDADDRWRPEKLAAQLAMFATRPSLGLVSCRASFVDLDGRETKEPEDSEEVRNTDGRGIVHRLLMGNCVSGGSNALIRKECFDTVGFFDETLRGVEDWEMWIRIAQRYQIAFVDKPLAVVRQHPTSLSAAANVADMLKYELLVVGKHYSRAAGRVGAYDRGTAYSHRYAHAASAYLSTGNTRAARQCILKSLACNPLHFAGQQPLVALLARVLLGDRVFGLLPRGRTR